MSTNDLAALALNESSVSKLTSPTSDLMLNSDSLTEVDGIVYVYKLTSKFSHNYLHLIC